MKGIFVSLNHWNNYKRTQQQRGLLKILPNAKGPMQMPN